MLLIIPSTINAKGSALPDFDITEPSTIQLYDHTKNKDYFRYGVKDMNITQTECLTFVIFGEARGEPDLGKVAVAFVIKNRAKKWNINYCDVVRMPGEFAFKINKLHGPNDLESWHRALNIAVFLIDGGGYDTLDSPVGNAIYFNSLSAEEQSVMGKDRFIRKIGHHYFYK